MNYVMNVVVKWTCIHPSEDKSVKVDCSSHKVVLSV